MIGGYFDFPEMYGSTTFGRFYPANPALKNALLLPFELLNKHSIALFILLLYMVFRAIRATTRIATSSLYNSTMLRMFSTFPSHTKLALPNLSPTMSKGNIAKWLKKEGDSFKAGEAIADIETDKATVAFEMLEPGYLAKILVSEGAKDVPLGTVIAVMCENQEDVAKFKDFTLSEAIAKKVVQAKEAPKEAPKEIVQEASKASLFQESSGRIFISPEAKKLAESNKLNISTIVGTGVNGRIILADIEEAMGKNVSIKYTSNANFGNLKCEKSAKPIEVVKVTVEAPKVVLRKEIQAAIPKGMLGLPDFTDIELTKYKMVTAERLTFAKQTIPHYYVEAEIEMDKVNVLRENLNKHSTSKITVNDMLIKACSLALLKVPLANSSWMGTHIRQYKDADISVAVQTPIGLITPIVYRANLKGMSTIASEMKDLAVRAKENKLKPEEFMGGTFTISNAGMYGISNLVPIVNPPQACIMGVGATIKRVVPHDGKDGFRIASMMTVSLACDHRVIDGATGSEYLRELKKILENPDLMML